MEDRPQLFQTISDERIICSYVRIKFGVQWLPEMNRGSIKVGVNLIKQPRWPGRLKKPAEKFFRLEDEFGKFQGSQPQVLHVNY